MTLAPTSTTEVLSKQVISSAPDCNAIEHNAKMLIQANPYLYDSDEVLYRFDFIKNYWVLSKDFDIMCDLNARLGCMHCLPSNLRNMYTSAVKILASEKWKQRTQFSAENDKYFVQFGNKIYNIREKSDFNAIASPMAFKFFAVPYNVGQTDKTPKIDSFFNQVTNGKTEMMKDIIAYCVYADNPLKLIFFHYGKSNSGKSQVLRVIEKFLGEDSCTTSTFGMLSDTSQRFELAKLRNKSIVTCSEIDGKTLYQTSIIKQISGMDSLRGEYKGNNHHFQFKFWGKAHIATNTIPEIKDNSDDAFKGRCALIEYPNTFTTSTIPISETIPDVEFENLACYCLNRLKEWMQNKKIEIKGLPEFEERIKLYRKLSNPVIAWFDTNVLWDKKEWEDYSFSEFNVQSVELLTNLNAYLQENGYKTFSPQELGYFLKNHFKGKYEKKLLGSGNDRYSVYYGFKIIEKTQVGMTSSNGMGFPFGSLYRHPIVEPIPSNQVVPNFEKNDQINIYEADHLKILSENELCFRSGNYCHIPVVSAENIYPDKKIIELLIQKGHLMQMKNGYYSFLWYEKNEEKSEVQNE